MWIDISLKLPGSFNSERIKGDKCLQLSPYLLAKQIWSDSGILAKAWILNRSVVLVSKSISPGERVDILNYFKFSPQKYVIGQLAGLTKRKSMN